MRNITTLALCTLVLSGCATAVNTPFASTRLILNLRVPTSMGVLYAMKNSPGFEKCYPKVNTDYGYSILGGHCAFTPKDTPDKIVIEYARFMSTDERISTFYGESVWVIENNSPKYYLDLKGERVSQEEWARQGKLKEKAYINSLPPSAWRTFIIYPKQLLKKYQGVTPEYGSANTSSFAKNLVYQLSIQPDSTIKTEEFYTYEYSGEGWRN